MVRLPKLTTRYGGLYFLLEAIPFCAIMFLGVFTLIWHLFLLLGFSFSHLLLIMPIVAPGVLIVACVYCSMRFHKSLTSPLDSAADVLPAEDTNEAPPIPLLVTSALAIVLVFAVSGNYIVSWGLSLALLLFCLFKTKDNRKGRPAHSVALTAADIFWPLLMSLAYVLLAWLIKRTDADDATFIGIAVHLLNNPAEVLFSSDPLFHGEKCVHSAHVLESFHALTAVTAHFFKTSPGVAAHYILAPTAAALFPLVWSGFFLRLGLAPRRIIPFLFLAGFVFAETHASFGNFTFVRFFQGKALLANLLVPYIYVLAHDFCTRRSNVAPLCLACVAAFGCSSSSVFIIPQVLFIALAVRFPKISLKRLCVVLLPVSAYAALLGLAFILGTQPHLKEIITSPPSATMPSLLNSVFGSVQQYIFLFLLLCAWAFLPSQRARRAFLLLTILWAAVPLNPLSAPIISKIVSPIIAWRELWVIPFWGVVGIGLWGIADYFAWRFASPISYQRAHCAIWVFFLVLMLPFANVRPANIERVGMDLLWYPARYASIFAAVEREIPPGHSIMGPADISAWLTTLPEDYSVYTFRYPELAPDGSKEERYAAKRILGMREPSQADLTLLEEIVRQVKPDAIISLQNSSECLITIGYIIVFRDEEQCLLRRDRKETS